MRSFVRSPAPAALPLTLILALGACGGGPRHIAEITPVVSARLSGAWILNEQESDDPDEVLRRGLPDGATTPRGGRPTGGMQPRGGAGRGGGMTGGGMSGGRMPGGGGAGARPSGGSRLDPRAMTALRRMATVPPRTLLIDLADSLVVITVPREDPWVLPFGDEVKRSLAEDLEVEAKAEWDEGRLRVIRKLSGGGEVSELFMPSVDGARLTVEVEFAPGGRGGVTFRRVYDAGPAGGPQGR